MIMRGSQDGMELLGGGSLGRGLVERRVCLSVNVHKSVFFFRMLHRAHFCLLQPFPTSPVSFHIPFKTQFLVKWPLYDYQDQDQPTHIQPISLIPYSFMAAVDALVISTMISLHTCGHGII